MARSVLYTLAFDFSHQKLRQKSKISTILFIFFLVVIFGIFGGAGTQIGLGNLRHFNRVIEA